MSLKTGEDILLNIGAALLAESKSETLSAWYSDSSEERRKELKAANMKEDRAYKMLSTGSKKEIEKAFAEAVKEYGSDSTLMSGMSIDWGKLDKTVDNHKYTVSTLEVDKNSCNVMYFVCNEEDRLGLTEDKHLKDLTQLHGFKDVLMFKSPVEAFKAMLEVKKPGLSVSSLSGSEIDSPLVSYGNTTKMATDWERSIESRLKIPFPADELKKIPERSFDKTNVIEGQLKSSGDNVKLTVGAALLAESHKERLDAIYSRLEGTLFEERLKAISKKENTSYKTLSKYPKKDIEKAFTEATKDYDQTNGQLMHEMVIDWEKLERNTEPGANVQLANGAALLVESIAERQENNGRGGQLEAHEFIKKQRVAYKMLSTGSIKEIETALTEATKEKEPGLTSKIYIDWAKIVQSPERSFDKIQAKFIPHKDVDVIVARDNEVESQLKKIYMQASRINDTTNKQIKSQNKEIHNNDKLKPHKPSGFLSILKTPTYNKDLKEWDKTSKNLDKKLNRLNQRKNISVNYLENDMYATNQKTLKAAISRVSKQHPKLTERYRSIKQEERKNKLQEIAANKAIDKNVQKDRGLGR